MDRAAERHDHTCSRIQELFLCHNEVEMNRKEEENLLAGARQFELQALGEIYDRYSPGLYRYIVRLLGDALLAEDCVAETFRRFLAALKAGRGPQEALQA
jgi:RNA polymerase sigma-70 factor (ECF subfamily)